MIRHSGSAFANVWKESGFLADVAHDCCKGIAVFDPVILKLLERNLFVCAATLTDQPSLFGFFWGGFSDGYLL
jgi:hypothetical protein